MGNICHFDKKINNLDIDINENEEYNFDVELSNFRGKNFKKVNLKRMEHF